MTRTMFLTALAASLALPAFAQEAPPRGWASKVPQADCVAASGLEWKESETWTRSDGKTRTSKARCAFSAKAAQAIIYSRLNGK